MQSTHTHTNSPPVKSIFPAPYLHIYYQNRENEREFKNIKFFYTSPQWHGMADQLTIHKPNLKAEACTTQKHIPLFLEENLGRDDP